MGLTTFCIRIAYDGTAYAGWQIQPHAATIQGCLERAAEAVNGEPTSVLGAGRTDAGVHADAQAARFRTPRSIGERQVPNALNAHLPDDIVVHGATLVPDDFHPIRDAVAKHYRYTFRVAPFDSPFDRGFVHRLTEPPNIGTMRRAAGFLLGKHDFSGFEKSGSPRPTTVRTLRRVDVSQVDDYIQLDIEGDGFLYGMARNLAGTLLRAGQGALEPDVITPGLAARDRAIAGPCLPARGLRLRKVLYSFQELVEGETHA
ncbi:MAG: tRNA pseudouridine(38-40) synthase TruA [Planctomycetota bacterium]